MKQQLIIQGDVKEVKAIIDRITKANPGMTVKDFINKYTKEDLHLS